MPLLKSLIYLSTDILGVTPPSFSILVKPQQSPYKKAGPPLTSAPIKPRAIPVIKPKAPDVVLKAGVDPDIQVSSRCLKIY